MNSFEIGTEEDIVHARTAARRLAEALGFSLIDKTRIATTVSELARNTLVHGGGGCMEIGEVQNGTTTGIRCAFTDSGPGIADIDQAMTDGFTTSGSMGHGLPGARRLMDDFEIDSKAGDGTHIAVVKWK